MQKNLHNIISSVHTCLTFSIGVVINLADTETSVDQLIALADHAMYDIKTSSKNSIQYVLS